MMRISFYLHPKEATGSTRCAIGRHRVAPHNILLIIDDKRMICNKHAMGIAGHVDAFYRASVPQAQIEKAQLARYAEIAGRQRKAEMNRRAGRNDPGWVYYMRMDDLIRIGYATDVSKRMRAYPPSAELLAVHPGTKALEKQMHDQFHAFLRRGREWFAPHEEVMSHVANVREEFGNPRPFAYEYRRSATA